MKLVLTSHDRKILIKRLVAAEETEKPDELLTVIHVIEVAFHQEEE